MLTFIRKITCRIACLCLVLVSFEVKDYRVWVRFISFSWNFVVLPGTRLLVFPFFDQSVAQRTGLLHYVSKFFDRHHLLLFCCRFCQHGELRFFLRDSGSTWHNHASGNHGTKRRFWFLDDSRQLWCLQRAVHPCGLICDGECECHSAVPYTLASKSL